jgi:hypothetical protein
MKVSKILGASTIAAVLGIMETLDITNLSTVVPEEYRPLVLTAFGLVVAVLRVFYNKAPVVTK